MNKYHEYLEQMETSEGSVLGGEAIAQLAAVRHVALDMDGTIYCGTSLLPETQPFLQQLSDLNITHSFITNNSSKSTEQYMRHLADFGMDAREERFFTSAHATIDLLRSMYPGIKSICLAGAEGLRKELCQAGYEVLPPLSTGRPDAVVVGFDPYLDFQTLCKAAYWVDQGLPYIATHPDLTCPTNERTILLDCGSLCAAIKSAVGRYPDAVAGKPEPSMLFSLCERLDMQSNEVAMVGDRMNTDILMAIRAGAFSVLTLTGETKLSHLEKTDFFPDLVINNLSEFGNLLALSRHSKRSF